ncbi:MAG: Wzz/FepE/Etk N-terminal domain-containing protein [Verrucomicrobiia bacterium]
MEEDIQLRDLIRALWRQKWWMMIVVLLVVTATVAVSLQMPKIYRATATLVSPEVDQAWPTPDGLKTRFGAAAVGGAIRPNTTATDVIMGLLSSRRLALAVIEKFDLMRVYWDERLIKLPPMPWQEKHEGPLLSDIVEELQDRTDIRVTAQGILSISVEDREPKRAAAMVQCYLDELERMNMELQTTYNQYLARVVDRPLVPDRKCKPRIGLNTLIAGVATIFLWVVAAFCRLNLAAPAVPAQKAELTGTKTELT